jgi:hypothetical protein
MIHSISWRLQGGRHGPRCAGAPSSSSSGSGQGLGLAPLLAVGVGPGAPWGATDADGEEQGQRGASCGVAARSPARCGLVACRPGRGSRRCHSLGAIIYRGPKVASSSPPRVHFGPKVALSSPIRPKTAPLSWGDNLSWSNSGAWPQPPRAAPQATRGIARCGSEGGSETGTAATGASLLPEPDGLRDPRQPRTDPALLRARGRGSAGRIASGHAVHPRCDEP